MVMNEQQVWASAYIAVLGSHAPDMSLYAADLAVHHFKEKGLLPKVAQEGFAPTGAKVSNVVRLLPSTPV